jgi:hypothetical protein
VVQTIEVSSVLVKTISENINFFFTVSCTIWDGREIKKAEMSVLDISSAIIERVESMPETCDYIYIGVVLSVLLSLLPALCRLREVSFKNRNACLKS